MGEEAYGSAVPTQQLNIDDPKVCKSYLVGTCPYDLFTNTKNDLGMCPNVHSEALRTQYQEASQEKKDAWGFHWTYLREMQKRVEDCDYNIDGNQRRLEKTAEEIRQTNTLLKHIGQLNSSIEAGMLEVEIMGEEGLVNMAVTEFFKVRQKKLEKEEKERELKSLSDTGGPSGHQKLQVCDVCGAYLSRLDNDRRLADHFYGKLHLGYAQMRKSYEALKKELAGKVPPRTYRNNHDHDQRNRGGSGGGYGGGHHGGGGGGGGGGQYGGRGGGREHRFRGGRGGGRRGSGF
ncbi:hypothetical protein B0J11DRAFT_512923 [Dendryphion nanum]|uniref:LUC7-domain-containing protein n=1 Tax=Dendryphion nanum TaxID=256645 RepID=A0A9P9CYI7_9PLEO|nr:hypothetical protein B0J11DRAFT_512923 [Dendryphion nanum]